MLGKAYSCGEMDVLIGKRRIGAEGWAATVRGGTCESDAVGLVVGELNAHLYAVSMKRWLYQTIILLTCVVTRESRDGSAWDWEPTIQAGSMTSGWCW